jgi:hypothetical protein
MIHVLDAGVIRSSNGVFTTSADLLRLASASGDSVEDWQASTVAIDRIAARKSACVAANMQMGSQSSERGVGSFVRPEIPPNPVDENQLSPAVSMTTRRMCGISRTSQRTSRRKAFACRCPRLSRRSSYQSRKSVRCRTAQRVQNDLLVLSRHQASDR